MKFIIDSSVAFKAVVPEKDSPKALQLFDDHWLGLHEFIAPNIFPYELAHAPTRAERQNRLLVGEASVHWMDIMANPPHLIDDRSLIERGIEIASYHRIGVYDCVYDALAEQEGCELITADDKLVRNLQKHFPLSWTSPRSRENGLNT